MKKIIASLFALLLPLSTWAGSSVQANSSSAAKQEAVRVYRESIIARSRHAAPLPHDRAADLVDNFKFQNLRAMEENQLTSSQVPIAPWSDFYWPIYGGGLAIRFADSNFTFATSWDENSNYLLTNLGLGGDEVLSPAEKYDLLVGDKNFTLSKTMIQEGKLHKNDKGIVETWFGICHGWAAAAIQLPRPSKAVTVVGSSGKKIQFNPSEIKALASLLYANAPFEAKFVGGRCEESNGAIDENGRETNTDCLDNNPSTWHMAVVNQIGVAKRSFVVDVAKNNEVWNHPAHSYSYKLFHPKTKTAAASLSEGKIALSDFPEDKFKRSRAPAAKYLVEVEMLFEYVTESYPSTALEDSPENDVRDTVTYRYDLELDENDTIVGGEWHSFRHPDFLWVPVKDAVAIADGDRALDWRGDTNVWTGRESLPAIWKEAAAYSSRNKQPLARIVNRLMQMSQ